VPNLIGVDLSAVVTPEVIAAVTLPGLPQSLLNTISGITADLQQYSGTTGEQTGDLVQLSQALTETSTELGLVKIDVDRLMQVEGDPNTAITLTEFINAGFGYEDDAGEWIEGAPFARAFDELRIDTESGSIAVYSFLQAIENRTGELEGRIEFAIDSNGAFTGIYIAGSPTVSSITFSAANLRMVAPDGTILQDWDTVNQKTRNYGTFFAENMEGDVTDSIVKVTTERTWDGSGDPARIAEITSVNVTSMPFDRIITCGRILYDKIGIQDPVVSFGGVVSASTQTVWYSASSERYNMLLTPPFAVIPANTGGVITINVGEPTSFDQYFHCPAQELMISVFKAGGSLS
jgi:hypothetical protein